MLRTPLLRGNGVIFFTYRPVELKGHPDGRAPGDGVGVGAEDVGERGAIRARRLHADDVLIVFEAHAEKYPAVTGRGATDAAGTGEGVDLQLKDPGGEGLRGETGGREGSAPETAANYHLIRGKSLSMEEKSQNIMSISTNMHRQTVRSLLQTRGTFLSITVGDLIYLLQITTHHV